MSRAYWLRLQFLTAYFQQRRTGSGHTRSPALWEQQPYERPLRCCSAGCFLRRGILKQRAFCALLHKMEVGNFLCLRVDVGSNDLGPKQNPDALLQISGELLFASCIGDVTPDHITWH